MKHFYSIYRAFSKTVASFSLKIRNVFGSRDRTLCKVIIRKDRRRFCQKKKA